MTVRPDRFLAGRHAIVTGGGRGIGAAVAHELARLGADLTLMGRSPDVLAERANELRRLGGRVQAVCCDVAAEEDVLRAFGEAQGALGAAFVLVNNAGQAEAAPFGGTSRALWERLLAVNLTGPFLCTQQVLPAMLEAGAGRIVNVASTAGLKGYTRLAAYCASKHGLVGLTRSLALETAKSGVTVNAVCPAYTDTAMGRSGIDNIVANTGKSPEEAFKLLTRHIPLGRFIRPDEVASAVGWLCSPEAGAVTGQALAVAGGEVM